MRYTSIQVQGQSGRSATITPAAEGEHHVRVVLDLAGGGQRTHTVDAADADDRWSMAQCMQETLDGRRGSGGDVRECELALELVARV